MSYKITNAISSNRVPAWGNKKKYIAVHYLGVVGQNHDLASDGCGAHFYIYWDGTIYQRCSLDAVPWAVGTAGYYAQKHPEANNYNTISIEMCCKCDGNAASANDPTWYFTQETQEACVWLVKQLMGQLGIAADPFGIMILSTRYARHRMCTTTTIIPVGRGMSSRKKLPDPATFFRQPRNHGTVSARPGRTPAARSGHLRRSRKPSSVQISMPVIMSTTMPVKRCTHPQNSHTRCGRKPQMFQSGQDRPKLTVLPEHFCSQVSTRS